MYRTYFFALMLFAMSCTNSTSKVGEDQQSSQQIEYVMNDSLSTDFYTDMKSYCSCRGIYTYSGYCSKDSGMRTIGNLWKGKYRERKTFFC